ncbi:uncharacterized protein LOC124158420 [Ischnura elegans]|uniref:uncharacterized protein LOC124158420 n=1 Tax=Ischnura elegans TaxID=197161 RepID=UPI001ED87A8D|nr:uncharacterized protein LOC124158420 [Ischnura elegans]
MRMGSICERLRTAFLFFPLFFSLAAGASPQHANDVFLLAPRERGRATAPARRLQTTLRDADGSRRILVLRPAADIRCYCNLPRCVTTGYMCKSASGACFSDLADRADVELATHGCIELLPSSRRGVCHVTTSTPREEPAPRNCTDCGGNSEVDLGSGGRVRQPNTSQMLLLCCHSDMCNHIDSPQIRLRLTNDSLFVGSSGSQHAGAVENGAAPALYSGHDGWFRVATIVVPICGSFILIMLIFVAFKILRRDSEDQKLKRGGGNKQEKAPWNRSAMWDEGGLQCTRTQRLLLHDHPTLSASNAPSAKVQLLADSAKAKQRPNYLDYLFFLPQVRMMGVEKGKKASGVNTMATETVSLREQA